jgi:PAS domain S-box-containing protein
MSTFRSNVDNAQALDTLETLTKQMGVAVTRCSRDFRHLWANQAYANWIQRPLSEVVGRPISEVLGKDAFECLLPHFNRVLAGEEVQYEQETNFRGVGPRWISATYTPTLDPNGITDGWVAVVVDITERRRAEQALCESEERLRLAAKAGRMFAYSWDAATDVIERSGESAEILGVEQKAAATGSAILAMVYPADKDRLEAALAKLSVENSRLQITYRMIRPDGAVIWVERNSCAYFDEHGKIKRIIGMVRDVTERRQAEEALRKSEERLRMAQWVARIGTFDLNIRTGVAIWPPETEALYGLPPGGFGGTLTAFENLIHPDDRQRVIELTREMMRTGQPTEGEWRVVWPDGSVHWIAGRGQVFMDDYGEPSRMLGVNIDVTDRKLAEQELATASERLHLAIDSGSVGGWDFDVRTRRNAWFGRAHEQLGLAPDESSKLPQEFWAHVHEDDRERLQNALQLAKDRHEEFAQEFRVIWRDGTIHWLRSRGRYYYAADGSPERMLGISVDITESKHADQALRESEQRLRLATQAGRMYAYDWDVTTNLVVRSSEHVKILGLAEPLRFSQGQFVEKVHPDDRSKFLAAVAALTPENPTGEVTYRALALDGSFVWLKSNGCGFFDTEGKLLRVIGMVADITDQKLAEETVSGMTRKLVEAQEQERTRIARELHDDINQRLVLLGFELNQLREKHNGLPSEVRDRMVELEKMTADLCTGVYALSHELHFSTLDLLGLPKGMSSWCKAFGDRHKIEIDFKNGDVPQLPQEISLCLFRILQEAARNAAKHSGGKRIDVQLAQRSGELHLIVSDSGRGFDIKAAKQRGGLGLTSMQERVRLVGGTIVIDSKPLMGTTVHVRVPFKAERDYPC